MAPRPQPGLAQAGSRARAFASVAAVAVLLLALGLWGWLRPKAEPPVIRYGLSLPASQAPVITGPVPSPAPDGSYLVYNGPASLGTQLWIKRRDSYTATPIAGTQGAGSFAISPDGEWIAFITAGRLSKIPLSGGTAVPLVNDSVGTVFGLAWLDDGTIVYPLRGAAGLMRVSATGGAPTLLWRKDSMITMLPNALPGSHGVTFLSCNTVCVTSALWAIGLKGDSAHLVLRGAAAGYYSDRGEFVYGTDAGGLFAAPFDLDRLRITGTPVSLGEQLSASAGIQSFSLSKSGTLVMSVGGPNAIGRTFEMVWVDRTGRQTPVDTAWKFRLTALANNHGWALSPDGSRLAIGLSTAEGDDIWVKPLPKGAPYRVTFDPQADFRPRWTSNGQFITFVRGTVGFYAHRADGAGTDSLLVPETVDEGLPSPDNRWIVLRQGSVGAIAGGRNITGIRVGSDTVPIPVLATPFDEEAVALSPDGKWMAYQSDETGHTEIFVRPFPSTNSGKKQVSTGGGLAPLWARDGTELFYLSGDNNMMAARMAPGGGLDFGEPVALFHLPPELLGAEALYYTPWDVARDGRFIMARLVSGSENQVGAIVVVENWIREMKAKVKK